MEGGGVSWENLDVEIWEGPRLVDALKTKQININMVVKRRSSRGLNKEVT